MNYITTQHMDYLTFSTLEFVPIDDLIGKPEITRPLIGNYTNAHRYDCGIFVQWHADNPRMKTHVTMTGKTLDNVREWGFTDKDIVTWANSLKKPKFGRIDLAITSWREDGGVHGFLPHMAHYYTSKGLCETQLTLDKPVVNKELEVETCYIGQRKKREMLRVYDKGIELGNEANRIIRIEMERRKVAPSIAKDVMKGHDYAGVIKRYFDFPTVPEWNEIMTAPAIPRNRDDEKQLEHDREQEKLWTWLFKSVAPAMARALYNDPEPVETNGNADHFARLVARHYNDLVDKNSE